MDARVSPGRESQVAAVRRVGGVVGGLVFAEVREYVTGDSTIVTLPSIIMAFGLSVLVGIIFGLYPAQRAAYLDPIEALRHS